MPWSLHTDADHAVISHGNIAPWHVVFRGGRPVGLIVWEYAGPVDPVDEVAVTAWYCVQLFDEDVAAEIGLLGADTRAEWFRTFLDGYGLARGALADLVDRILRFAIKDNGWHWGRHQGAAPAGGCSATVEPAGPAGPVGPALPRVGCGRRVRRDRRRAVRQSRASGPHG